MITKQHVCIVIPAYNEEKVIAGVIKRIYKATKELSPGIEIVVVNDGSTDKTSRVAADAGATVINHILNSGAGSATATGLSYANQNGFSMAATMDADGQHDPDDVLRGFKEMVNNGGDLVIGSRLIDARGMSRLKIIGNKGLSAITYLLFGTKVTDSQSGLRIFSRKALETLRWKTSGYEFCSEMLWRANQLKLVIREYPIKAIYSDYSTAKGQNNWNGINILKSLIRRRITEIFE